MNSIKIAEKLYESAKENGLVETLFAVYGNNIKTSIAYSKRACETSIDEIEFSVRSSNALKRTGLMTVGDVIDAIADERLLQVRNLGRKSYNEIKTRILKFGYDQLTEKEKLAFFVDLVEKNRKEPLKKAV
jgi:DNA-directed RNA polymerase alpha subunit